MQTAGINQNQIPPQYNNSYNCTNCVPATTNAKYCTPIQQTQPVQTANYPQVQYPQVQTQPNYQIPSSASGVNIQIFNPSVTAPGAAAPTYNVNSPCYPANYYTGQYGTNPITNPNGNNGFIQGPNGVYNPNNPADPNHPNNPYKPGGMLDPNNPNNPYGADPQNPNNPYRKGGAFDATNSNNPYKLGSVDPNDPHNPANPYRPGGMLDPNNPNNPYGADPQNPNNPYRPGGAFDPTNPNNQYKSTNINPNDYNNPANPYRPGGPLDPTNPNNPYGADVNNPNNPYKPGGIYDPTNPNNPYRPGGPINPTNPQNNTSPSNPYRPGGLLDPNNPNNPYGADPTNPNNPYRPGGPLDPNNPDNPYGAGGLLNPASPISPYNSGNNGQNNNGNNGVNSNLTNTNQTKEDKKTEKKTVVELTDQYIMSLENELNSQDKNIRLNGAKAVFERLDEDPSRKDDKALTALINKMLQDPSQEIRLLAFTALDGGICNGDELTAQLLRNIQTQPNGYGMDAIDANKILLRMAGKTVEKEVPIDPNKKTIVKTNKKDEKTETKKLK